MNANIPAFYDRCGPDSIGRNLNELEPDQAVLIERFIDGQCNSTEHRQLAAFLLCNPEWISWIASRVNDRIESSHQDGRKGYFLVNAA